MEVRAFQNATAGRVFRQEEGWLRAGFRKNKRLLTGFASQYIV